MDKKSCFKKISGFGGFDVINPPDLNNEYIPRIDPYSFKATFPSTFKVYKMNPTVTILVGIPTSGKSTWAIKQRINLYTRIISRDELRLMKFGKNYKHTKQGEDIINTLHNETVDRFILLKRDIILDNAHCREVYIKDTLKRFENTNYTIRIKFFDIPLWKAYYRNIKRKITTGKWIPIKVIQRMKENYDKINKKDYAKYEF